MRVPVKNSLLSELRSLVGADYVLERDLDLSLYSYDATLLTGRPDVVVLPGSTEEVAGVVRLAREEGLPVTARGSGTSLSGGPVPTQGGIVVALTRMDRLLEVDLPNQRAVVQPGLINLDLINSLEPRGFLFAPDPSSQSVCTLGGNVGENSGGPHCLKYGVTANHITGVQMVLADGEVLQAGGKALDPSGYDLLGVIMGSEGTFGIVTEITCRIQPLPEAITTMLAVFDSLEDASRAVSGIIGAGLLPATLEMMDQPMMHAVQMAFDAGYPEEAQAVLIIEIDGLRAGMDRQVQRIEEVCTAHGARNFEWATDPDARARLWRGRKGAFGAVANITPGRLCSDVAVPRTELPRVLSAVMDLGAKYNLRVGNVFHAGDGNLHPQVMFDPADPDEVTRAQAMDEEITRLAVQAGGVLTGEHGIGCCKRKYMSLMFPEASLRGFWGLKDAFDPKGLLNPAKVLPERDKLQTPEPSLLPEGSFMAVAPRLARTEGGVSFPYDAEAAAKLLALASREHTGVLLRGNGSKLGETADTPVISTTAMNRVLDVNAENMTVSVEAGLSWSDLQAAVREHGQVVPLWPPHGGQATVGGVVATDGSGPHRLLHGTCRDLVLGMRFALPGGEVAQVGGRCVKNVSGYALDKLMIGSHGSLGCIVEVTFRTRPLPERVLTLCLAPSTGDGTAAVRKLGTRVVASHLIPSAFEALSAGLFRKAAETSGAQASVQEGWAVAVALEGLVEEVEEMTATMAEWAAEERLTVVARLEDEAHDSFWKAVTDLSGVRGQCTCTIADVMDVAGELQRVSEAGTLVRAGLGTGVVGFGWEMPEEADLEALTAKLEGLASCRGGAFHWLPPFREGAMNPVPQGPYAALCRRIKDTYDPEGILPPLP